MVPNLPAFFHEQPWSSQITVLTGVYWERGDDGSGEHCSCAGVMETCLSAGCSIGRACSNHVCGDLKAVLT